MPDPFHIGASIFGKNIGDAVKSMINIPGTERKSNCHICRKETKQYVISYGEVQEFIRGFNRIFSKYAKIQESRIGSEAEDQIATFIFHIRNFNPIDNLIQGKIYKCGECNVYIPESSNKEYERVYNITRMIVELGLIYQKDAEKKIKEQKITDIKKQRDFLYEYFKFIEKDIVDRCKIKMGLHGNDLKNPEDTEKLYYELLIYSKKRGFFKKSPLFVDYLIYIEPTKLSN